MTVISNQEMDTGIQICNRISSTPEISIPGNPFPQIRIFTGARRYIKTRHPDKKRLKDLDNPSPT